MMRLLADCCCPPAVPLPWRCPSPVQRAQRVVRGHHSSVWVGACRGGAAGKGRGRGGNSWRQWLAVGADSSAPDSWKDCLPPLQCPGTCNRNAAPSVPAHLGGGGLAFGGGAGEGGAGLGGTGGGLGEGGLDSGFRIGLILLVQVVWSRCAAHQAGNEADVQANQASHPPSIAPGPHLGGGEGGDGTAHV